MNIRGLVAMALVFGLSVVASAQTYLDTPDHHWAYEDFRQLKRDGLFSAIPEDYRGHLGENLTGRPTRYLLAVHLHACYADLLAVTGRFPRIEGSAPSAPIGGVVLDGVLRDMPLAEIRRNADAWPAIFDGLLNEFAPELRSFGVDVPLVRVELRGALARIRAYPLPDASPRIRPFWDVPETHWAARQIFELKRLGILVGYPNGAFQ